MLWNLGDSTDISPCQKRIIASEVLDQSGNAPGHRDRSVSCSPALCREALDSKGTSENITFSKSYQVLSSSVFIEQPPPKSLLGESTNVPWLAKGGHCAVSA